VNEGALTHWRGGGCRAKNKQKTYRFNALSFTVKGGYIWNVTVAYGSGVKCLDLRESGIKVQGVCGGASRNRRVENVK